MSPGRGTRGRRSAGLLLFRSGEDLEVLLVHPGGPFWAQRDLGAWSIPKGECEDGEDPLATARREFGEELGTPAPQGEPLELGEVRQKAGKTVLAWAIAGDLDPEQITSNTFTMEWPPRSGRSQEFPEVDRAGWFGLAEARERINPAQVVLLDRLSEALSCPNAKGARGAYT
ncbi:MAG: NUDIX domain-containing protein [Solirubrobacteraceae bacterium]